jgi:hypothetical protein
MSQRTFWLISRPAKHRTLSPVVTAFIKCARTVAKPLAKAGAD